VAFKEYLKIYVDSGDFILKLPQKENIIMDKSFKSILLLNSSKKLSCNPKWN